MWQYVVFELTQDFLKLKIEILLGCGMWKNSIDRVTHFNENYFKNLQTSMLCFVQEGILSNVVTFKGSFGAWGVKNKLISHKETKSH